MSALSRLVLPDGSVMDLHGSCTLGRAQTNSVPITDDHVSRKHAVIQFQGEGGFCLVDLGSINGTSLNGRRLLHPQTLRDGDFIELGDHRIEFRSELDTLESTAGTKGISTRTLLTVARRDCWLMVADIVSFTRMAQTLPPEELPRMTGSWFKNCRDVIEDRGGHMNQYLGDGYLCYWENTMESKSQVLGALRDLEKFQNKNSPPFRVVLHHGMTVFGSVPTMIDQNLHGPAVIFAFRMEKLAAKWGDKRLCSEAAWRALGVGATLTRESLVGGYDGVFQFHVPDLSI